ncbi:hypothetical protein [Altererythrobacter sp. Z27]|uniref:hypothetical protein n=1 Tax=Altererythrobacter sp. Z27 TaxID=3461147 RepID=UPI004044D0C0
MGRGILAKTKLAITAAGIAALAACAAPPPPPAPVAYAPPPPPPRVVIPPRPTPPAGAFATMAIPQMSANGVRQTVNTGISSEQKLWNLRSGLNVAALNCLRAEHAGLVENYRTLLKQHSRQLAATNNALTKQYRDKHGKSFRDHQDAYMTRVYNYFALPPVLPEFCNVALQVSQEVAQVKPGQLHNFAEQALPRLEAVYEQFFSAYEKYRVDLAAWDARYGAGGGRTMEATYNQVATSSNLTSE